MEIWKDIIFVIRKKRSVLPSDWKIIFQYQCQALIQEFHLVGPVPGKCSYMSMPAHRYT